MSAFDLWVFGEDGCLQKFDADHSSSERVRSFGSGNKFFSMTNVKARSNCLDLPRTGENQKEQHHRITSEHSASPTLFRKGFGVLSVKPLKRSSKNKEKRHSLKILEGNLFDVPQDKYQCANIATKNLKDIRDKSDTKCASDNLQRDIQESQSLSTTEENTVPKYGLITDDTCVTPDSSVIFSAALDAMDNLLVRSPKTNLQPEFNKTDTSVQSLEIDSSTSSFHLQDESTVDDASTYAVLQQDESTLSEVDPPTSQVHQQDEATLTAGDPSSSAVHQQVKSTLSVENRPTPYVQQQDEATLTADDPSSSAVLQQDKSTISVENRPTSYVHQQDEATLTAGDQSSSAVHQQDESTLSEVDLSTSKVDQQDEATLTAGDQSSSAVHQQDESTLSVDDQSTSPVHQQDESTLNVDDPPSSQDHQDESALTEGEQSTSAVHQQNDSTLIVEVPFTSQVHQQDESALNGNDQFTSSVHLQNELTLSEDDRSKSCVHQKDESALTVDYPSSSSVRQQDESTLTVNDTNMLVSDKVIDKSFNVDKCAEVSQASNKGPLMTASAVALNDTCAPDERNPNWHLTSVTDLPKSCSRMSLLANENSLIEYLTEASQTTVLMSTSTQRYVVPSSKTQRARKCSENPPTPLESKTKRIKICDSKSLKPVAPVEMYEMDAMHSLYQDTSDTMQSCSQMSFLANENSLNVYSSATSSSKLLSACTQTYNRPLSKSGLALKILENAREKSKVKLKFNYTHVNNNLEHHAERVPKTATISGLSDTCSDAFTSSTSNPSTSSLSVHETNVKNEPADGDHYASSEFGSEVRIKTEPSDNGEFSSAVLGSTLGIKREPLDDGEYTSVGECQNKDLSYTSQQPFHTSLRPVVKQETFSMDGVTNTHKHTSKTFAGIELPNELSSNLSCDKSNATHQTQQPHGQMLPQPMVTDTAGPGVESQPLKISSVFSLKCYNGNMSIQDIMNLNQQGTVESVSHEARSEIESYQSKSKKRNVIKFPEELKRDPCLQSHCRVVLERIQIKNGLLVGSKSTKTCMQQNPSRMSRKKKPDISGINRKENEGIGKGFNSSSNCSSSLPGSTRIPALYPAIRTLVPIAGLQSYGASIVPYQQRPYRLLAHSFSMTNMPRNQRKFYIIDANGRQLVIPSVRLNVPRMITYQQSLNGLTTRSFPGMQLPNISKDNQFSKSFQASNLSIKTAPITQGQNVFAAARMHASSVDHSIQVPNISIKSEPNPR